MLALQLLRNRPSTICALVRKFSTSGTSTVTDYKVKPLSKVDADKILKLWDSVPTVEAVVKDIKTCLSICAARTSNEDAKDFIVNWERKCTFYHITKGQISIELPNNVTDSLISSPEEPVILVHPTYSALPQEGYRDLRALFEKSCEQLSEGGAIKYRCVWLNTPPIKICASQPLIDINAPIRRT